MNVKAGIAGAALLLPPAGALAAYERWDVNPLQREDACLDIAVNSPPPESESQDAVVIGPDAEYMPDWCQEPLERLVGRYERNATIPRDLKNGGAVVSHVLSNPETHEPVTVEEMSQDAQDREDTEEANRDNAVLARTIVAYGGEAALVGAGLGGVVILARRREEAGGSESTSATQTPKNSVSDRAQKEAAPQDVIDLDSERLARNGGRPRGGESGSTRNETATQAGARERVEQERRRGEFMGAALENQDREDAYVAKQQGPIVPRKKLLQKLKDIGKKNKDSRGY